MADDDLDLTGAWKGIFNYPRSLPANQFDADLREHLGAISGETFELGNGFRNKGKPLHALIDGRRDGREVNFVKFYDEVRRHGTPVHYFGTVSGDGSEISGTWDIPGQWSGTFLMIRAKPKGAEVERKTAETVR